MTKTSTNPRKHQSARKHKVGSANFFSTSGSVPRGLVRCPVCNEFRGAVINDDLPPSSQREEGVVPVLCICDGIPCRECGIERIHRPISNFWDEERGAILHCPWFTALAPCNTCRTKRGRRTA